METMKIEDVAKIIADKSDNNGLSYLEIGDIDISTKQYFIKEKPAVDGALVAKKNHVLVSKVRPTRGAVTILDDDYCVSNAFVVLETNHGTVPKYLFYSIAYNEKFYEYLGRLEKGTSYPSCRASDILSYKIPLKPKPEQEEIVAKLDFAESLRQKRKEQLALLDDYLKSVFLEMFGDPCVNDNNWPLMNFRDVSERFSDGPFGSNLKTEHYQDYGVRVVRLQNIGVGEFNDEDKAFISEDHFESLKKHTCKPGDILIATMGDPNIRSCVLPETIPVAINKADCIQMRPNINVVIAEYINSLLNSSSAIYLVENLLHGQTRSRISMGQLSRLNIPIPPIKLQHKFINIVKEVRQIKQKMRASLAEMDNHFNALMQRYFG